MLDLYHATRDDLIWKILEHQDQLAGGWEQRACLDGEHAGVRCSSMGGGQGHGRDDPVEAFAGVVVSDFATVSTHDDDLHQLCCAHLLRDLLTAPQS